MQLAFLMQLFQSNDDLRQHLGGFLQAEHPIFKFRLIVDEISPITVLQQQMDVILIFLDIIEVDDIGRLHRLHALDLSVEILLEMGLILDHFYWD